MDPLAEMAEGSAAYGPDGGGGDGAQALGDGEVRKDQVVGARHRYCLHGRRQLAARHSAAIAGGSSTSLAQPDLKH